MKNRQIGNFAKKISKSGLGRILVFTGARQTGKTTLVKKLFPEYSYLSIEDPLTRADFTGLTAARWHALYPKAILDEIQKEPGLIESIKAVYDQFSEQRYVLLGSSQLLLMEKVRESLAGRCVIIEMFPLTLPEIKTDEPDKVQLSLFQKMLTDPRQKMDFYPSFNLDPDMAKKQTAYSHYSTFGGYPALTDTQLSDEQKYIWLGQYVRTYLERDIRDLASFRELEPFVILQRALAVQTAQTINASTLATQTGLSVKTVQRYIQYLNISYQTISLQAWSRNQTKKLTRAPKIHYLDHGVLSGILQKKGGMTGAEYESLVVAEIYKQIKTLNIQQMLYHLRIQGGREIDLLIELPEGYIAFEIKMSQRVSASDTRHFSGLDEILDKPLLHSFVISNDVRTQQFPNGSIAINAAMFLG